MKMNKLFILTIASTLLVILYGQNNSGALKTARMMERKGEIENAIAIYSDILDKGHDQKAYTNLKKIYFRDEKYDELISTIQTYKDRNPQQIDPHLDLGEAYWKVGNKKLAKREWDISEKKYGGVVNTYKKFYYLFIRLGMSDETNALIRRAREKFNDPSVLSLEIANYHFSRKSYETALKEYLNYLSSHPMQIKMVTNRILLISDDNETHELIVGTLNKWIKKDLLLFGPLLADFFFKTQQYEKAISQHQDMGFPSDKDVHRWLELANSLRKESQHEKAIATYETILNQNIVQSSPTFVGQTLLGLGKTFEDNIIPNESPSLSFVSFLGENMFFEDPFYHQQNISVKSLDSAFELYDSLLTSMPLSSFSASAYHRLGEIQFKMLSDFDGALKSYRAAIKSPSKAKLKKDIQLRIGEMYLSKGDLNEAQKYFKKFGKHNNDFRFQYILSHLYSGEIDTAFKLIELSIESTKSVSHDLNDLLELRNFISTYFQNGTEEDRRAFKMFIFGEFYLRQKKLPEAIASFSFIQENYPKALVCKEAILREALVHLKMNQISEAEVLAERLTETKSADKGWTLLGEIYEIFRKRPDEALQFYYKMLEDYPNSYMSEPVRLHIRSLKNQLKS